MHGVSIRAAALAAGLLFLSAGLSAGARAQAPLGCPNDFELAVLELVNDERALVGLPPLDMDVRLSEAAQLHSDDMGVNGYFSHTSQDGTTFDQRIVAAGYTPWYALGENIAAGQNTPEWVMDAWMNSPGHRANILNPDFDHIGIGYVYVPGSPWGHYWTQDFGRGPALDSPVDLCPSCSDMVDNDLDGKVDHPEDPQCVDGFDNRENPARCGLGFELVALLPILATLRSRRRRS